jgi:hypothetical protein
MTTARQGVKQRSRSRTGLKRAGIPSRAWRRRTHGRDTTKRRLRSALAARQQGQSAVRRSSRASPFRVPSFGVASSPHRRVVSEGDATDDGDNFTSDKAHGVDVAPPSRDPAPTAVDGSRARHGQRRPDSARPHACAAEPSTPPGPLLRLEAKCRQTRLASWCGPSPASCTPCAPNFLTRSDDKAHWE